MTRMHTEHTDVRREGMNDTRDAKTGHLLQDTLASSASLSRTCLHEPRNRAKSVFANIKTMRIHIELDV